jgi:hypothetical protein
MNSLQLLHEVASATEALFPHPSDFGSPCPTVTVHGKYVRATPAIVVLLLLAVVAMTALWEAGAVSLYHARNGHRARRT